MLSGGLVAGQAIVLVVSPILTRLYTPSEFGVYSVFTALNAIFINLVSLRYELAVPVAPNERDAAALACLALLAASAISLAGMPVVWLAGDWLAGLAGMPLLAQALWLLPPVVAVYSAGDIVSYWSIYRATFRLNATGRLVQGVSQSALQVGFGLVGYHGWGLLAGFMLGCLVRLGVLVGGVAASDRRLIATAASTDVIRLARANWQYPAYSTPASLLEASTQLLPLLFLAALFGPAFAGLYGLGQRLMGLPIRLFATAARNVFLGEAAQRHPLGLYRLFKRSSLLFLGLGVAGLAPVLLAGPALFAVVFGEGWRVSGEIAQLLVPLYLTRFVVTPVSQVFNILGRQRIHLISSSLDAVLLLASVVAAWWLALPPMVTILLFTIGSTITYSLYFVLAWRAVRRHVRAAPLAADASSGVRADIDSREPHG